MNNTNYSKEKIAG